jgi:hypothetical protein
MMVGGGEYVGQQLPPSRPVGRRIRDVLGERVAEQSKHHGQRMPLRPVEDRLAQHGLHQAVEHQAAAGAPNQRMVDQRADQVGGSHRVGDRPVQRFGEQLGSASEQVVGDRIGR